MANQRVQKSSSWTPQTQAKSSQFASPPIPTQAKAPTPQDIEHQAFREQKHETLGLQLQAKYGTITPQGQERLTLLQAKMDTFRRDRLKSIPESSLLDIPNLFAPRETPQPIQPMVQMVESKRKEPPEESAEASESKKSRTDSQEFSAQDLDPQEGNKTLLLGEGDFSFALSLVKQIGGQKVVATSYDSQEEVENKYNKASQNISELKKQNATIEHRVDAKNLQQSEHRHCQNIVFNFPFIPEEKRGKTEKNKALLNGFFESASRLLITDGRVFLSLASDYYVNRWKPDSIAKEHGFNKEKQLVFQPKNFPGYEHRMTVEDKGAGSLQQESKGITFVFIKKN